MKYFLIINLFFVSIANAQLDQCLIDAKSHGSHKNPVSPRVDCVEIIKTLPDRVEAKSKDGSVHIFGISHLVYVSSPRGLKLLSGDQTELKDIKKIEINELKRRILILQSDSISTFNLDFIGNVSPVSHLKSKKLSQATRVKLLDDEEIIAIFSEKKLQLINSDAETRYDVEKTKPRVLRHFEGKSSQLRNPSDLIYDTKLGKIFVLDTDRVLIFSISDKKNQTPEKVINSSNLSEVHSGYNSSN